MFDHWHVYIDSHGYVTEDSAIYETRDEATERMKALRVEITATSDTEKAFRTRRGERVKRKSYRRKPAPIVLNTVAVDVSTDEYSSDSNGIQVYARGCVDPACIGWE